MLLKACEILKDKLKLADTKDQVVSFIYNRLKAYYQDQGIEASLFLAVLSTAPQDLVDFDKRVKAVKSFKDLPEAENLASAYKRVNNILSKAESKDSTINDSLLQEDAEKALVAALNEVTPKVNALYDSGDYNKALATLSELKVSVDNFFDKVMVNADDLAIKNNRIAILVNLHDLIGKTADISVLY